MSTEDNEPLVRGGVTRKSQVERAGSLADPNYKGEDYKIDIELEKGPLTNRRCTDFLCLIIFSVMIGGIFYVAYYAVEHGDPDLILAPLDADGKFCGRSPGYEDYKYLYYSDISSVVWFPYSVCVKACPSTTVPVAISCAPTDQVPNCNDAKYARYNSTMFLERWCIPDFNSLTESQKSIYNNMIGSIGIDDIMIYIDDIIVSWPIFLIAIGSCIVLVFFYNILLRCCAEILAWISIITVGLGLACLGWFIRAYGKDNYPEGDRT